MFSTNYEGLSYPNHVLKSIGVVLLGILSLNTELNKPTFLRNEMFAMNFSLQIKQKIYSIGISRAPVVTQII